MKSEKVIWVRSLVSIGSTIIIVKLLDRIEQELSLIIIVNMKMHIQLTYNYMHKSIEHRLAGQSILGLRGIGAVLVNCSHYWIRNDQSLCRSNVMWHTKTTDITHTSLDSYVTLVNRTNHNNDVTQLIKQLDNWHRESHNSQRIHVKCC